MGMTLLEQAKAELREASISTQGDCDALLCRVLEFVLASLDVPETHVPLKGETISIRPRVGGGHIGEIIEWRDTHGVNWSGTIVDIRHGVKFVSILGQPYLITFGDNARYIRLARRLVGAQFPAHFAGYE